MKINWDKKQSDQQQMGSAHADYTTNLENAKQFLTKIEKYILPGMKVQLENGNDVLMFAYKPPCEMPMGDFANPVPLHQDRSHFTSDMKATMNFYHNMVKGVLTKIQEKKNAEPAI